MIQLDRQGLSCNADLGAMRRQFERDYSIRIPQLIHPDLMRMLAHRMAVGSWIGRDHEGIGRESALQDEPALNLAHFAVNTPVFLNLIAEITQCGIIAHFEGRIYRLNPDSGHYDSWHDDVVGGDRLVGMSINLSPKPYSGGVFRLRERESRKILSELPNVVPGDAILFRISPRLQHMVTALKSTEPKTAFAGWFKNSGHDFFYSIRRGDSLATAVR